MKKQFEILLETDLKTHREFISLLKEVAWEIYHENDELNDNDLDIVLNALETAWRTKT